MRWAPLVSKARVAESAANEQADEIGPRSMLRPISFGPGLPRYFAVSERETNTWISAEKA